LLSPKLSTPSLDCSTASHPNRTALTTPAIRIQEIPKAAAQWPTTQVRAYLLFDRVMLQMGSGGLLLGRCSKAAKAMPVEGRPV